LRSSLEKKELEKTEELMEGVGTVERKLMKLDLPEGGLRLAYGGVLKEIEVAYEECGAPVSDGNVIYICHALTGDAHVAGIRPGEQEPSGWWEEMVGPGRAFDTNRFHIVCANVLGGCSGTTGPMSVNPDTGKPYGSAFPQYNFDDAVDVFRLLLKQLGIRRLAAVVGGSYGGLQVVNWMTRFPEDMDKACLIATSAHLNTQAIALSVMSRNSITYDPNWLGGDYYAVGDGKGPQAGLASARQLAHITYLSRELLQQKFERRLQREFVEAPEAERAERDRLFKTYFQVESYLDYQAMKFLRRFDANSYLHITRSMDLSDPCDRFGSLDAAFARVKAKTLVVSYENDILFPDWQSKEIVASLMKSHKSVSYCHLESGTGHDSFLTDIEHLSKIVGGFLSRREVKIAPALEKDYGSVLGMVRNGAHVVDIGCGDGTLLDALRAEKGVRGDGVEIDVDCYEEALADGHDMFWGDVDNGLGDILPDRHYDTAIVSDTLQEVKNPRGLLQEALRIADEAIVTFPNFAAYRIRLTLALTGRLPVSKHLPFQWYDTPNIHCITLKDFKELCKKESIDVLEVRAESRHIAGKILMAIGLKNLGASRIVARIARKKK
jgi:homoserine O-acetyltransferase/O-succinyltransferase